MQDSIKIEKELEKYINVNSSLSIKDHSIMDEKSKEIRSATTNEWYVCPIGGIRMITPFIAEDGYSYEESKIKEYLDREEETTFTSPVTNETINKFLLPNYALFKAISCFFIDKSEFKFDKKTYQQLVVDLNIQQNEIERIIQNFVGKEQINESNPSLVLNSNKLSIPVGYIDIIKKQSFIAEWFTCPLTRRLFINPVVATDGFTYENAAILPHIFNNDTPGKWKSPCSEQIIDSDELIPNYNLSAAFNYFVLIEANKYYIEKEKSFNSILKSPQFRVTNLCITEHAKWVAEKNKQKMEKMTQNCSLQMLALIKSQKLIISSQIVSNMIFFAEQEIIVYRVYVVRFTFTREESINNWIEVMYTFREKVRQALDRAGLLQWLMFDLELHYQIDYGTKWFNLAAVSHATFNLSMLTWTNQQIAAELPFSIWLQALNIIRKVSESAYCLNQQYMLENLSRSVFFSSSTNIAAPIFSLPLFSWSSSGTTQFVKQLTVRCSLIEELFFEALIHANILVMAYLNENRQLSFQIDYDWNNDRPTDVLTALLGEFVNEKILEPGQLFDVIEYLCSKTKFNITPISDCATMYGDVEIKENIVAMSPFTMLLVAMLHRLDLLDDENNQQDNQKHQEQYDMCAKIFELLVSKGINVNAKLRNKEGTSYTSLPFYRVTAHGCKGLFYYPIMVKFFLDHNVDPALTDHTGQSWLSFWLAACCDVGDEENDKNTKSKELITESCGLIVAKLEEKLSKDNLIRLLNWIDNNTRTVLDYSIDAKIEPLTEFLKTKGALSANEINIVHSSSNAELMQEMHQFPPRIRGTKRQLNQSKEEKQNKRSNTNSSNEDETKKKSNLFTH